MRPGLDERHKSGRARLAQSAGGDLEKGTKWPKNSGFRGQIQDIEGLAAGDGGERGNRFILFGHNLYLSEGSQDFH